MNKKNQVRSLNGGIPLSRIPYKLNQLPFKPIVTLAVDKLTQSVISFSIQEAPIAKNFQIQTRRLKAMPTKYVRNSMGRHLAGNRLYLSVDSSPELSNASFLKAMKDNGLHPKHAGDSRVVLNSEIERILKNVFLILSQSLRGHPRPSPKNPPLVELWRQRGHRFPRN